MPRGFTHLLVVVLLAPSLASLASSAEDPAGTDIVPQEVKDAVAREGNARIIVAFEQGQHDGARALAATLRALGRSETRSLDSIGVVVATVDPHTLPIVAQMSGVLAISPDRMGSLLQLSNACGGSAAAVPTRANAWWLGTATKVNDLNRNAQGQGKLLAVVDSGVSVLGPMSTNYVGGAEGWRDFTSQGSSTPVDTCGHGTKVASIAVGPVLGVAPQAKWMAARITTDGTDLSYSSALSAFDWLVGLEERPDAIVNSWGFTTITDAAFTAPFLTAVNDLQSTGSLVVFAAGDGTVYAPAAFPEVTAVGYSTQAGQIGPGSPAGPSCYGPGGVVTNPCATMKPDLVAPGANMVALLPGSSGSYASVQGTSFAAPFAAGAALLVREENPSLTGAELGLALEMGANFRFLAPTVTSGAPRPNVQFGYGLLNAERAAALPGRSNRVLLIGDDDDVLRDALSSNYEVTSLSAARGEDLRRANRTLVEYGVIVLANLNSRFEYGSLIEHAKAVGTGIVVLGDPGLSEYDGVQAYVENAGGTMIPWSTTSNLQGALAMATDLFPGQSAGNTIELRAYSDASTHAVDGYSVDNEGHRDLVESSQSGQPATLVSTEDHPGGPVYVLANSGSSSVNPAGQITQDAWKAFDRAVQMARSRFLSPDEIPIDAVAPAIADVVIVGDAHGQLAQLAADVQFTSASIPSWDLDTLQATIEDENSFRTANSGRSRVRLLVFNDFGPDPDPAALAAMENARLSANFPISAIVLGGAEASALSAYEPLWGFTIVGSANALTVASPDSVNQYEAAGVALGLNRPVQTFSLPTTGGWKASYVTSDSAATGVAIYPNPFASNTRAIVGFSAADVTAGGEVRDIVSRTLLFSARVPLIEPIIIGANAAQDPRLRWDLMAGAYVLNAYEFRGGTLVIRGMDENLLVQNSVFVHTGVATGILIEDSSGDITIEGNYFSNKDPAIRVIGSPGVRINHNIFDRNYRALERPFEDYSVSALPIDAGHNYFSVVDTSSQSTTETEVRALTYAGMLQSGLIVNPFSPTVPSPTYVVRDTVTPGFQVLPYYEDKGFSRPVPPPLHGYIDDVESEGGGTLRVSEPTVARVSYPTGRGFNLFRFTEGESAPTQGSTTASAPGTRAVSVFLAPGTHDVIPEALSGRGDYQLMVTSAPPMPYRMLLDESFSGSASNWAFEGEATVTSVAGSDGGAGVLRMGPAPGAGTSTFTSDLHELDLSTYVRLSEGARLLLQVNQSAPLSHPVLQLRLSTARIESPTGYDGPGIAADSWHKIELRFAPPMVDLYVDNKLATSIPLIHSPVTQGVAADATIQLVQDGAGILDVDDVLVYQGELLPGALIDLDFEGVDDGVDTVGDPNDTVVIDGRGSQTGATQITARPLATSMQAEADSPQESPSTAAAPIPRLVQEDAYGYFGGSPTYADGQSLHVSTESGGQGLQATLPDGFRHYHLQQLVNLPQGGTFNSFTVLGLTDASGRSIFRLTLDGGSGWLSASGNELVENIAYVKPARWHKLDLIVTEGRYHLLLDETPVAQGVISLAPPGRWEAGFGTGSMLVDNLRFGFDPVLSSDVSASSTLAASWTPTQTETGSIRLTTTVPATSLPGQPLDLPMLADYTVHIVAPVAKATKTYVTRSLPTDSRREYEAGYALYLPGNTTVAAYDGFHLFRAEDAAGLICSLALYTNDDVLDIVTPGGSVTTGHRVARETWHALNAHIQHDGKITFTLGGEELPTSCPAGSRRPTQLVVGDVSTSIDPLRAGASGYGEVYLDDLSVRAYNNAPNVAIDYPSAGGTVGGLSVWSGTAADADAHDAVSHVELTLRKDGNVVHGPWKANGTTNWNTTQETWTWPKGTYSLEAVASDGRLESATVTRSFAIDNSPLGGIESPMPGTNVGGITTIAGGAAPRFPRFEGENVESVRWRVGTNGWNNTSVEDDAWSFPWNTTAHPRGSYIITVESSKWLDTSTWSATYNVNNSPSLSISSPAAGANVGGLVTVAGSASPRYPLSSGEQVDSIEYRVDGGAWMAVSADGTSWAVVWNTSGLSKGSHSFEVRSTKWLDSTLVARTFTVDNSPDVAVSAPAPGAQLGGDVTFTGTARDRYTTYSNDVVDSLRFRIDSGVWMTGNVTHLGSGSAQWSIRIDTHSLPKGSHKFTVVGTEDDHERWVNHTFSVDNTPVLDLVAPEQGASMDDRMYLRVLVTDPYPTPEHPYPTSVVLEDSTGSVELMLDPDPSVPGRVMAWRNVGFITPGPKTLTFRAYDGMENAAVTVGATVETGDNLALKSGVPRFATLFGPTDRDTYKIDIPADATELRLSYHTFQVTSSSKLYLRFGGAASPTTYDFASNGDGTDEELVLTPLSGLRTGTAYLWVQATTLDPSPGSMENAGDYRLRTTITRLGGGGILG